MSSDNYNLVRKRADGRWDAWQNLDASSDYVPEQADITYDTFEEAFEYADKEYAEYGTRVETAPPNQEPRRPPLFPEDRAMLKKLLAPPNQENK